MRAAIYNGKGNISLTELDTPKAGENDIVVRNLYASICGTDVAVYKHGPNTGHRITAGADRIGRIFSGRCQRCIEYYGK